MKVKSLSRVQLLATPWTAAYQAPPSMGFSRQEYWSGVPLPSHLVLIAAHVFVSKLISILTPIAIDKSSIQLISHVQLLATPWTAAHQAPPSMGFSRPEYWRGVPLPSLGGAALLSC